MTWRVLVRDAAITDLREARRWYEEQRAGLGKEFLLSIAEVLLRLEENPESFPIYYRDFRRALVRRFPYKVFFRISGDAIMVFRLLHAARDHIQAL